MVLAERGVAVVQEVQVVQVVQEAIFGRGTRVMGKFILLLLLMR